MTKGNYIMKKIFAIAVITAMTVSALCGCGKKNEVVETTTTTVVEEPSAVIEEPTTVEPTEESTEDSTEATPSEAETTVNLPSDEYLVDNPLTVGDQKVYFKYPAGFNFNSEYSDGNVNAILCKDLTTDIFSQTTIEYFVNHPQNIDFYKSDNSYDISEESCDNGITIYTVTTDYGNGAYTIYVIDYNIDDTNYVQITITMNPLDANVNIDDVLDFYRNAEDLFVVQ